MTITAEHPEPDPYDRLVLHLTEHPAPIPHDLFVTSLEASQ